MCDSVVLQRDRNAVFTKYGFILEIIYSKKKGSFMKYLVLITLSLLISTPVFASKIGADCTYKGKKLYGKIKFVENFEDIKIKVVDNFQDIKVQKVSNFANSCGKWQVVENFEDVKVKVVSNFEDIKVKYVDNFPGL